MSEGPLEGQGQHVDVNPELLIRGDISDTLVAPHRSGQVVKRPCRTWTSQGRHVEIVQQ